jgi:hypothetical protein
MTRNYIAESMDFAKEKMEYLSRLSPPSLLNGVSGNGHHTGFFTNDRLK